MKLYFYAAINHIKKVSMQEKVCLSSSSNIAVWPNPSEDMLESCYCNWRQLEKCSCVTTNNVYQVEYDSSSNQICFSDLPNNTIIHFINASEPNSSLSETLSLEFIVESYNIINSGKIIMDRYY